MTIEFHPDVVAVRLKQIQSARKTKSDQSDKVDEKAALNDMILSASTMIYDLHGQVGLSRDKPGTLLDAYLETKKVIEGQRSLLVANLGGALQLGTRPADTAEEGTDTE